MSATLAVSVTYGYGDVQALWSVLVRVRPARGRMIERCLATDGYENIEVPAGEVTVDAVLASGAIESHTLELLEGEVRPFDIRVKPSPHETMSWLAMARETPRAAMHAGTEPTPKYRVLGRDGGQPASIVFAWDHPEGHVLHLQDTRSPSVLQDWSGSRLAVLSIESPASDRTRVAALPGPLADQVHVALRPVPGSLPDVQIVPTTRQLTAIVGFLERRNQSALAAVQADFMNQAIAALQGKAADPIGAAVGLAMLLRLGEARTFVDWSRNLWHWFPALSDGAALHTAVLMEDPRDDDAWLDELKAAALEAARVGMPLLSDALRALRKALRWLREADPADARVAAASAWCDRLVRAMDDRAVFTTVTLRPEHVDVVWGVTP